MYSLRRSSPHVVCFGRDQAGAAQAVVTCLRAHHYGETPGESPGVERAAGPLPGAAALCAQAGAALFNLAVGKVRTMLR